MQVIHCFGRRFNGLGTSWGGCYAAAGLPPPDRSMHERVMAEMLEWMLKSGPEGADVKSWR